MRNTFNINISRLEQVQSLSRFFYSPSFIACWVGKETTREVAKGWTTLWSHAGCSCLCIKVLQKLDFTERSNPGEVNRSSLWVAPQTNRMWRQASYCHSLSPYLSLSSSQVLGGKTRKSSEGARNNTPPPPLQRTSEKVEKPGLPTSLIFNAKSAELLTAHAWHLVNEMERSKCIDILNSVSGWLFMRRTLKEKIYR